MTHTISSQHAGTTRELRYHIVQMNLAADNIVPSLAFNYATWGYLHDAIDAMSTPCTSQDVPLREPAYYTHLAGLLADHHNAMQKSIRTCLSISPRATYVRDQLIKGSYAAAQIGAILSRLQLNQYHNIINERHPQLDLQPAFS